MGFGMVTGFDSQIVTKHNYSTTLIIIAHLQGDKKVCATALSTFSDWAPALPDWLMLLLCRPVMAFIFSGFSFHLCWYAFGLSSVLG